MGGRQGGLVEHFTIGGRQPGEFIAIDNSNGSLVQAGLMARRYLRRFHHSNGWQGHRFNHRRTDRRNLRCGCRRVEGAHLG